MSLCRNEAESESGCSDDFGCRWSIVESRRKQKFLLVFGVKESITLVGWLVSRTVIRRLGNHMRIIVKDRFAKVFTQNM